MIPTFQRLTGGRSAWLAALAIVFVPAVRAPGLGVQNLVDQVAVGSYRDFLDDELYTHDGNNRGFTWHASLDRYLPAAEHDPARDNVLQHFQDVQLEASLDAFTFTSGSKLYAGCNNVLGVLPGRISPERVYVVGAHYDSVQNPGADDNASGVAGVMEAARILSEYSFASTILFAAWDAEERGLKGSWHWVNENDPTVVDGVVNLDMIAYNHNGQDVATVYGSTSWRAKWADAVADYCQDVTAVVYTSTVSASDHWPFQANGRPAGGIIENTIFPLPNPNYHKQSDSVDTPGYIDYDYAADVLRSAVGLAAREAGLLLPGDTDRDGDVDYRDYVTLKRNFGTTAGATWYHADFDRDGDVDFRDYRVLANHFGETLTVASGTPAVPEPATVFLLAAAAPLLTRPRRRPPPRAD